MVLKRQGRSIRWLAGEVGVSENYISQMKHGRRPIPQSFAVKASHALSLPMELLFLPSELHDVDEMGARRDEQAAD
jgi:transcriptional regulator with XRE-family HTH domain